jgi:hypothetical protein
VPNRHSASGGNMNECPVMALAMTAESVLGWPLHARGVICPRAVDGPDDRGDLPQARRV